MQIQTSHSMPEFGLTVRRLLEELEDVFPPVNPTPDTSVGHIMYRAGQRSVVEWIENRLDEDT